MIQVTDGIWRLTIKGRSIPIPTPIYHEKGVLYYLDQEKFTEAVDAFIFCEEWGFYCVELLSAEKAIQFINKKREQRRKEKKQEKQIQLLKSPIATTFKKIAQLSASIAILPVAFLGLIFKK